MDYMVQYYDDHYEDWSTMSVFSCRSVAFDYMKLLRAHVHTVRMMPTIEYK